MIYVYALLAADADVADLPAGIGGAPVRLVRTAGVTVAVSEHDGGVAAGLESAWEHERVVEAAMAVATVLPVRFGTVVDGVASLCDVLAAHAERLRGDLARVADAVELSVHTDAGAWLPAPLAPHVRAVAATRSGALACLVPRDRVDEFLAAMPAAEGAMGSPAVVTGPWPPYSFVGARLEDRS